MWFRYCWSQVLPKTSPEWSYGRQRHLCGRQSFFGARPIQHTQAIIFDGSFLTLRSQLRGSPGADSRNDSTALMVAEVVASPAAQFCSDLGSHFWRFRVIPTPSVLPGTF